VPNGFAEIPISKLTNSGTLRAEDFRATRGVFSIVFASVTEGSAFSTDTSPALPPPKRLKVGLFVINKAFSMDPSPTLTPPKRLKVGLFVIKHNYKNSATSKDEAHWLGIEWLYRNSTMRRTICGTFRAEDFLATKGVLSIVFAGVTEGCAFPMNPSPTLTPPKRLKVGLFVITALD
jgi:hypothetical protein